MVAQVGEAEAARLRAVAVEDAGKPIDPVIVSLDPDEVAEVRERSRRATALGREIDSIK